MSYLIILNSTLFHMKTQMLNNKSCFNQSKCSMSQTELGQKFSERICHEGLPEIFQYFIQKPWIHSAETLHVIMTC